MYQCPECGSTWVTVAETDAGKIVNCDDCGYQDTAYYFTPEWDGGDYHRYRAAVEREQMELARWYNEHFTGGESDDQL